MYRYLESGLQNIWLESGYAIHKTAYGEGVSIHNVAGLHKAIGRVLAASPRLTGTELRFLRKELALSQRSLADLLGTSEQNVSLWERHGKVPKWSARLVKLIYVEQLDGNVQVRKMIDTFNAQDNEQQESLRFKERAGQWKVAA